MDSMSQAVEITLHFKQTAKSAEEWAEYHHDTYGFELVSHEEMTCVVVPAKTSLKALVAMLKEDSVHHQLVAVRASQEAA
jgi:hypothetical protein